MKAILLAMSFLMDVGESGQKRIVVQPMGGFEQVLTSAMREAEVPVRIAEGGAAPELVVTLERKHRHPSAQVLYQKNTGRSEDSILAVTDSQTGRSILRHEFRFAHGERAQQRTATAFVKELKDRLSQAQ